MSVDPFKQLWRGVAALALLWALPAGLAGQESDDAARRARARDEWYNEAYGAPPRDKGKRGGPWSAAYRRFMMDAAARERAKWGAQIPSNPDAPVVPQPEAPVAATGSTWVSLGPTKADF